MTTILTTASLAVTALACALSNSWLVIWICLELNTLAFCSMLKQRSKNEIMKTMEMSMKYFVVQSIASVLLVFAMVSTKETGTLSSFLVAVGLVSLIAKMASAPFHQWFIIVTKNSKWMNSLLLMTWQKLAPLLLIFYQSKISMIMFISMSALLGSTQQMNKTNILEILAYSSVFNLGWMLMAIILSMKTFLTFSLLYWASVIMMMVLLLLTKQKTMKEETAEKSKKWVTLIILANLAGIPPLSGFLAKWTVFSESLKNCMKVMVTVVLTISSLNLFIYLRMMNSVMLKNTLKTQFAKSNQTKKIYLLVATLNLYPLTMLSI